MKDKDIIQETLNKFVDYKVKTPYDLLFNIFREEFENQNIKLNKYVKSTLHRTKYALNYLFLMGLAALLAPFPYNMCSEAVIIILSFIISIIAILSINEIFSVMNTSKNFEIIIPSVIFVAIYPIFKFSTVWQFSWYFYSLWMFAIMILRPNLKLKIIAVTYTMSILISLSLGTITELKDYGKEFGTFYVLLALAIAWMSDTGAYFCGK